MIDRVLEKLLLATSCVLAYMGGWLLFQFPGEPSIQLVGLVVIGSAAFSWVSRGVREHRSFVRIGAVCMNGLLILIGSVWIDFDGAREVFLASCAFLVAVGGNTAVLLLQVLRARTQTESGSS